MEEQSEFIWPTQLNIHQDVIMNNSNASGSFYVEDSS